MAYGSILIDTITGSGASSVIINNGTSNVAGFTTGNNLQMLQNGGGIVFSNSSATTNSTLNDYETGTWTPTDASGAGLTFSSVLGFYTKIGRLVVLHGKVVFPSTANTSAVSIGGFPFSALSSGNNAGFGGFTSFTSYSTPVSYYIGGNGTSTQLYFLTGSNPTNANYSTLQIQFCLTYLANF
jgi:hypothetical protein